MINCSVACVQAGLPHSRAARHTATVLAESIGHDSPLSQFRPLGKVTRPSLRPNAQASARPRRWRRAAVGLRLVHPAGAGDVQMRPGVPSTNCSRNLPAVMVPALRSAEALRRSLMSPFMASRYSGSIGNGQNRSPHWRPRKRWRRRGPYHCPATPPEYCPRPHSPRR